MIGEVGVTMLRLTGRIERWRGSKGIVTMLRRVPGLEGGRGGRRRQHSSWQIGREGR